MNSRTTPAQPKNPLLDFVREILTQSIGDLNDSQFRRYVTMRSEIIQEQQRGAPEPRPFVLPLSVAGWGKLDVCDAERNLVACCPFAEQAAAIVRVCNATVLINQTTQ